MIMKREDIKEAAVNYDSRLVAFRAFMKGADWRINSVWHDVNQEPSEKRVLIVIESDGRISQSNFMVGVDIWEDFIKDADIVKWCYKEDLLPNTED